MVRLYQWQYLHQISYSDGMLRFENLAPSFARVLPFFDDSQGLRTLAFLVKFPFLYLLDLRVYIT